VHQAIVSQLHPDSRSVSVEWLEQKELKLEEIFALNSELSVSFLFLAFITCVGPIINKIFSIKNDEKTGVGQMIEYFDGLINEVDLKAETLLDSIGDSRGETDAALREHVHKKRQLLIEEIKSARDFNVAHVNQRDNKGEISKKDLFKKHCFFYKSIHLESERFREIPDVTNYCELNRLKRDLFGYLIVLDGYLTNRKMSLFREIGSLHFRHENDSETRPKKSRIFNADYADINVK
jgi:hypothetical protein